MKITEATFAGSSIRVSGKPQQKLPEFAFIGRSNVGKSSLINMLCGQRKLAMTSGTPGKTRLVNHFLINRQWYLVDLPGYGYAKLPHRAQEELRTVINDYLLHSEELALVFVLVDARHDPQAVDLAFLRALGEQGIPFSLIFTKCDKLGPVVLDRQVERYRNRLLEEWETLPPCFKSSAQTGLGREEILDYVESVLKTL